MTLSAAMKLLRKLELRIEQLERDMRGNARK
jgi:hypothetical protein